MREPAPGEGAMKGGGDYAAHSQPQRSAGELALGMLERACAAIPLPGEGGTVLVADMGAAQGRSELAPLSRAVRGIRARTVAPVEVVHTDIPGNDWTSLFRTIEESDESYLRAGEDVFHYVAGRSFYVRLFPDGRLHLGWSAIAVNWLSRVPADLPGEVYCAFAEGAVADAFRERSRRDWQAFLESRRAELVPGGEVIVVGGWAEDDGTSGAEPLMGTLGASARDLAAAGRLRQGELDRMTVPTWNRTTEEFLAPLSGPEALLEVVEQQPGVLPDVFLARYAEDEDAERLAADATAFVRAFSEPSLVAALDPDRTAAERAALADDLYAGVRARGRTDPESVRADWHVMSLRLRRPRG